MAISPRGTFDYVTIVPARSTDDSFDCVTEHRDCVQPDGSMWLHALGGDDRAARLVGPAPRLRVSPGGLTPDAGPLRPCVMRSCFTLTASSRKNATVAAASFHVDAALTSRLLEGDYIYLARTACGGLGLSAVRQGTLIFAVGAVTAVPLGRSVTAQIPMDLVERAAAVFQERDATFEFPVLPLEVVANNCRTVMLSGLAQVGGYTIFLLRSFLRGIPGQDECAAVWLGDRLADAAAHASAMLLDAPDPLETVEW